MSIRESVRAVVAKLIAFLSAATLFVPLLLVYTKLGVENFEVLLSGTYFETASLFHIPLWIAGSLCIATYGVALALDIQDDERDD